MAKKKKIDKKKKEEKSNFFVEVFREFSIINWPSSEEFRKTTGVVIVFVFIYIIYIGALDYLSRAFFEFVFK